MKPENQCTFHQTTMLSVSAQPLSPYGFQHHELETDISPKNRRRSKPPTYLMFVTDLPALILAPAVK
ncbi:53BP1 protein [Echinococcus multilocularis]|uniref:53BP1 protein n=1 Tax=Echinococcus multilocularis TaxID=6211 RepID=A0A0S4MN17_ECHMU|nr:53BP1 protein [Echinococcus multilocularis]